MFTLPQHNALEISLSVMNVLTDKSFCYECAHRQVSVMNVLKDKSFCYECAQRQVCVMNVLTGKSLL